MLAGSCCTVHIMEYLVIAVILYFILQTAGNLVLILRGKGGRPGAQSASKPQHEWKGPSPREQTGKVRERPTFWGQDIDEARWSEHSDG